MSTGFFAFFKSFLFFFLAKRKGTRAEGWEGGRTKGLQAGGQGGVGAAGGAACAVSAGGCGYGETRNVREASQPGTGAIRQEVLITSRLSAPQAQYMKYLACPGREASRALSVSNRTRRCPPTQHRLPLPPRRRLPALPPAILSVCWERDVGCLSALKNETMTMKKLAFRFCRTAFPKILHTIRSPPENIHADGFHTPALFSQKILRAVRTHLRISAPWGRRRPFPGLAQRGAWPFAGRAWDGLCCAGGHLRVRLETLNARETSRPEQARYFMYRA